MTIQEMSFTGGVLIAAILLLRRLTLFRLPKWTFLLLWGTALCRLLLPFSFPSPFSLYTGAEALAQAVESAQKIPFTPPLPQPESHPDEPPVVILPLAPQEKETAPARPAAPDPEKTALPPLTALYLTGAGLCALWFAAAYLWGLARFRDAEPVDAPILTRWRGAHPRPRVRFRQSRAVSAPLTYGLLRPTILFPLHMDWSDSPALSYVLAHEYVHIRRRDVFWKLLLAAALCAHWFNPLVWAMYIFANRDLELACDEAVVHSFGLSARPAYALSLLQAAESRPGFLPLCSGYKKSAAEERILAIMKTNKSSLTAVLTGLIVIAGTITVFATGPMSVKTEPVVLPEISQTEPAKPVNPLEKPELTYNPALPEQPPQPEPVSEPEAIQAEPMTNLVPPENEPVQPEPSPVSNPQRTDPVEYPTNSQGHTYGAWTEANGYDNVPDLLYVQLDQATSGYVLREQMYPYSYPLQTEAQKEEYLDWYVNHPVKRMNTGDPHEIDGFTGPVDALVVYKSSTTLYDQEERPIGLCPRLWGGVKYDTREEAVAQMERGEIFMPYVSLGTVSPERIPANRRTTSAPASDAEELIKKYLVNGDWPRNSAGQTYGPSQLVGNVGYYPDLLASTAMDGTPGYVRFEDSFPCGSSEINSMNAVTYQIWLESQPYVRVIPVYDLDGHVVGVSLKTQKSPNEATKDDISMAKETITADLTQLGYSSSRIEEIWTAVVSQYGWVA